MNTPLRFTRFTTTKPDRLSKYFNLVGNRLVKHGGGNMNEGMAARLTVNGLVEFADLLPTLSPKQALAYGVIGHEQARVVTAEQLEKARNENDQPVIARTRDHLTWPDGPGLMMLDYDAPTDSAPLDMNQLRDALALTCLPLDSAPTVWRPSASSCIYSNEGQELRPIAGQRLYIAVVDARDIPRAGAALSDRLWLAGYGRYELSKSGAFLARSLIDASVFQPERLDFCGGAALGKGLVQRLPDPIIFNPDAPYLDTTRALPDLTPAERNTLEAQRTTLQATLQEQQAAIRAQWIKARVNDRLEKVPEPQREQERPQLEKVYRQAADNGRLSLDFELIVKAKSKPAKPITVAELLRKPKAYHEAITLDPLEPDYPEGQARFVGWLNLNAPDPYLQSQAHGGTRYFLGDQAASPSSSPDVDENPPPPPHLEGGAGVDTVDDKPERLPKTLGTVVRLLSEAPWAGVIGYNRFRQRIEKREKPPYNGEIGAWSDADSAETMLYFEEKKGTAFGRDTVDLAVMAIARRNIFNPAQERLRALADQWDGQERLSTWLERYANAKVNDSNRLYLAEIGEKWMKGVVARVLYPGCKRDDVPVLRGPQGWFKSTLAEAISESIHPEAFTDSVDLGNLAEAKIQIRGVIIAELGELAGLAKGEIDAIKAFVSTKSDHFREKFGKFAEDFPRTVSFIGSTNDQNFLKDPTGNRRWWPITVDKPIDIPAAKAILPQLIGEAARRVMAGEAWYVSDKIALEQADKVREAHYDEDPWTDDVLKIAGEIQAAFYPPLTEDNAITSTKILDGLKLPRQQQTNRTQKQVASILRLNGYKEARAWTKKRVRKFNYWKFPNTRDAGTAGYRGTDTVEEDETCTGDVPGTFEMRGTESDEPDFVPGTNDSREHAGYGESLDARPLYPRTRQYQGLPIVGEIDGQEISLSPLATRILEILSDAPGGMELADLIKTVGNAKGTSAAMVEMTVNQMLLSGQLGKTNGRLVVNR